MPYLTTVTANLLLTLLYFYAFHQDSIKGMVLAFLSGLLGAGVSLHLARVSGSLLGTNLLGILGLLLGALIFWWLHSDRTSPRYGGGDFFLLEVAVSSGIILLGYDLTIGGYFLAAARS